MEKYKVLHVGTSLHSNGGVEKYFIELLNNINKSKFQIDLMCSDKGYIEDNEKLFLQSGGNLYKIKDHTKHKFRSIVDKYLIFKNYSDGIIHIHTTSGIRAIDGLIAKVAGVKNIIFHSHSNIDYYPLKYKITQKIFRTVGVYFLGSSHNAGRYFFGENIDKKNNFSVANNGINLDKFKFSDQQRNAIRSKYNISPSQIVYGYVGRFSAEKNIYKLMEIFNELYQLDNTSMFLVIGDGDLEEQMKKYVEQKKLKNNTLFLGVKNNIHDFMCAMDAFILPSKREGLGIVLIEAQSVGLKCYTTHGIPLEAKVTNLVNFFDVDISSKEWAEKIQFDMSKEDSIRKDMSINVKSNGYDIKDTTAKMSDIYLNLLKGR